jgi:two-component system, NtrC family, sensor kinase
MKEENPIPAQTQRLASLGFMLAAVCHEVSNPLAAASSMLQILQSKRGVTPETMEKGLASIAGNVARVVAITKKLGDYSRVGSEAPAPLAIDEAVKAAATQLRHSPCGHGVKVDYRGAPGVTVLARPGELERVVFNVFLNAAQAMEGAGRIEVQARPSGTEVALAIRDTGPGIAAEHLGRVFDPFFTTKQPGEGTGLGLAISYEIVHELGGTIRAANHPQRGALFKVSLPKAPV